MAERNPASDKRDSARHPANTSIPSLRDFITSIYFICSIANKNIL